MLHRHPHTVEEADAMLDQIIEVRSEARAHHNRALVIDMDDRLAEVIAERAALLPTQTDA